MNDPAVQRLETSGNFRRIRDFLEESLFNKGGWRLWTLALTALFLVCNLPLILGRAVGKWDVDGAYMAYYVLVADLARAGRFLYWDPWSNAGMPMMGDPQVGAFSPLTLLFGLLTGGTTRGFIVYWLFVWWLGGLGIMKLARHFEAPPWGGFAASVGYLFCGAYTGHAQHTSIVIGLSFLPWIIWRLDIALMSSKFRPALEAGALWGLSALSAYPGITIITGCFAGMWALGRYPTNESWKCCAESAASGPVSGASARPRLGFMVAALALMCVVGALVMLPTYFSFLHEGAGLHSRVGPLSRESVTGENAMDPGAVLTAVSNYLSCLQMCNRDYLWPRTDISMSSIYTGSLMAAFGLLALLKDGRDSWRWWLVFLGLLSLACAMGRTFPLRGWLYDYVFPMRFFRHSGIFRVYFVFAVIVLALLATRDFGEAMRRGDERIWERFFMVSIFLAPSALAAGALLFAAIPNGYGTETRMAVFHMFLVWVGLLAAATLGRCWGTGHKRFRMVLLLMLLVVVDAMGTIALAHHTVFNFISRERWMDLDRLHSSEIDLTRNGLWRGKTSFSRHSEAKELRNDQMISKGPVFLAYGQETNVYHLLMTAQPALRRPAIGEDRIWFSPEALQTPVSREFFDAWAARVIREGAPTLLVHPPEEMLGVSSDLGTPTDGERSVRLDSLAPLSQVQVRLLNYLPEELSFEVTCPGEGWLLVTDRWARNWRVEVSSKKETVYGGNFIFRAIKVSEGLNRVRFTFRPSGFPWLLVMSWSILIGVFLASLLSYGGLFRSKKERLAIRIPYL